MCVQKIRAYELQYEKSLQEARELAVLARRQMAAELKEHTPGDYDDEGILPYWEWNFSNRSLCLVLRAIKFGTFRLQLQDSYVLVLDESLAIWWNVYAEAALNSASQEWDARPGVGLQL